MNSREKSATAMGTGSDVQYFFQLERMLVELQLHSALRRATALRARAARQKDFACALELTQFEQILLHSQRQLNKLQEPVSVAPASTQSKAELTAKLTGR